MNNRQEIACDCSKDVLERTADLQGRSSAIIETCRLTVTASNRVILRNVTLSIQPQQVFGIIGPSGAGKSTLLKCLNRLIDLTPNLHVDGHVLLNGHSIYHNGTNVDALRARIGILFQQPVVFPKSIRQNVVFGVRHLRRLKTRQLAELAEQSLREAALWEEVKDRLDESALLLSVGQQQRLCLARTLAVGSEVILMDEPTSALDPRSSEAIEELILGLKERHTIILVTHNVAQAQRVTDWLACVCVRDGAGEVVESACCETMLNNPQCRLVIDYLRH
jgi:phosphate transport system ATP-binding protein